MKTEKIELECGELKIEGNSRVRRTYIYAGTGFTARTHLLFLKPEHVLALHRATGKRVKELRQAGFLPKGEEQ